MYTYQINILLGGIVCQKVKVHPLNLLSLHVQLGTGVTTPDCVFVERNTDGVTVGSHFIELEESHAGHCVISCLVLVYMLILTYYTVTNIY